MQTGGLFNLIIYSKKGERGDYIRSLANKIIQKFPSRLLFVLVDPNQKPDYFQTTVSQEPHPGHPQGMACDSIEIILGESAQQIAPLLILPHLISDLPVYLLWMLDIKENSLSKELERLAQRIIFDSEAAEDLPAFARSALNHYKQAGCAIADLNWARMESWRDLLASTFSPQDQLRALEKSKEIHLTYNMIPSPHLCHTRVQAIYLMAWLASRLNWRFEHLTNDRKDLSFFYTNNSTPVIITLSSASCTSLSPGTIMSMHLTTTDHASFTFTRHLDFPHQITLEITTPDQCYLPSQFIFAKGEAGGSLLKEVLHKGTSAHFLNVLEHISQLPLLCPNGKNSSSQGIV
ncbi:MAG: hypothetical protein A2Y28_04265 [Chlamydiae bacterium GWC2_50_10]|nr:MAG: hypothetical protein A2Z85_04315 [Chlamydiae bacterium GWA2_50_15]OGN53721.1 MAG: hypothetical protein A2Y28_04265 [Chlamydiae bacterium GWC2_50_10]OGN54757.1 MAG: hypothetical protein A2098_04895 [Chlamydiae bacterium GWF2_49_8]OGN58219.1 MAG: hypothetical protein A3D18_02245 [Chlamydiae bacterium RIFCSPHIGHO2_02_FULL_49_29]OGN62379.1 MAG: hypothetical protein A3E26_01765 [Chlamydiae bacterium RIFCSPHIGHO2_12_FULL_49_32]OGN68940.1 MAG: hypothetical protein A3I15_01075 [Chlamydiae bact